MRAELDELRTVSEQSVIDGKNNSVDEVLLLCCYVSRKGSTETRPLKYLSCVQVKAAVGEEGCVDCKS